MASTNTIGILISAKDEASKTLASVSQEIKQTGNASEDAHPKTNRFADSVSSVANVVKGAAISFAAYKIGQTISDFASTTVNAAAELEQTNMAFQSLTGNAQVANSVFSQLVQYANVTPFESKDIEKAAQTLMSFGTAGQQTVDIIKQLGDVTSVGGGDLQALSLVTGQVFAQGKMRAQDMYQVINDGGAGLIKVMAQNAGGMQKLTDEFNNGGIPAKQYFDAITQATKNGGFAFEGAQKQADTFNGRLSTLKDAATQFGEKLLGVKIDPQLGLQVQPGGIFDRMKGLMADLSNNFSDWGAAAGESIPKIMSWLDKTSTSIMGVYQSVANYLGPKLGELWKSFSRDIVPILTDLWHNVLEPLIPVLGTSLVVAIGAVVDVADKLFKGIGFVYKQMKDGNPYIWGLIGAFGTLASVMTFNVVFDALTLGFTTFRLITIPSVIASMDTIATSSAGVAAKQIAGFVLVSAKAVIHAVATAAAWVGQAAVVSAKWLIELPKLIASMSVVAVKATLHAADTALAWTLNAIRVSLVWTVTEMPKLVASFAVTATKAVIHAGATSLAWVTSATRTSTAWVISELPKIIAGFAVTSVAAAKEAAVSSAAWVASASKSAVAWVVTELPRIIAAFVATSAAAVANAAMASAAWVSSAVTSTQSFVALRALVSTPMVMPAIAVGAALFAIQQVWDATQNAISAIDQMNRQKAAFAQDTNDMAHHFLGIVKDPNSSADAKARAKTYLHNTNFPGYATGTNFAPGGFALVGENGPELVNLPRGSQVKTNSETKKMMGGASVQINGGLHIHNQMDEQKFLATLGWRLANA